MMRILLDGDFNLSEQQKQRLRALGEVHILDSVNSSKEWINKVQGYDVICTWGDYVIENIYTLENVFITYPYTELGNFDSVRLAKNNVFIANARGGNRKSIAEWVMFMILALFRKFPIFLRTAVQYPFTQTESIESKKVVIIGHGTIGSEVGDRCASFGMEVEYFNRGNSLEEKVKTADVVVNALNCNSSTENLLDASFFLKMKKGSYYITFARPFTYDIDGLISAIDAGIIEGAAIDCDPEPLFDISNDFYKKCLRNEKILVTPHVAGVTKQASANGLEIMVQNIEAFVRGERINIVTK